jgi:hypothetical protein
MDGEVEPLKADESAPPQKSNLRSIDGGRFIHARDVHADLATTVDDFIATTETMAGYFLLVWDDEGVARSALHIGVRNPYGPALIPDLAKNMANADVYRGEAQS